MDSIGDLCNNSKWYFARKYHLMNGKEKEREKTEREKIEKVSNFLDELL